MTRNTANGPRPRRLQVDHRPVAELRPYERNPRTHTDEQVAQIAASIRQFGFANSVLLDHSS